MLQKRSVNSVSKRNIFYVVYGLYIVLLYLYISFSIC